MSSTAPESAPTTARTILEFPPEIWLRICSLLFAGSIIGTTTPSCWRWNSRNRAILHTCRRINIYATQGLYQHAQLVVSMADDPARLNAIPRQIRHQLQRIELVEGDRIRGQGRASPNFALFPVLREVIILPNSWYDHADRMDIVAGAMTTDDLCRMVLEPEFLLERMGARAQAVRLRQSWIDELWRESRAFKIFVVGNIWVSGRRPLWVETRRDGEFALVRMTAEYNYDRAIVRVAQFSASSFER